MSDAIDKLLQEHGRMKAFIENLALHGLPCDMTPTRRIPQTDEGWKIDGWWMEYLGRVNEALRDNAKHALNPTMYEVREKGANAAMFTGTFDECQKFASRLQVRYTIDLKKEA